MSDVFKRVFMCDSEEWVAWISGTGAYGTGKYALGSVAAVHFAKSAEPLVPLFEALSAGELDGMFDDELVALFRTARQIVDASQLPEGQRRKARARSLQDHGPPPGRPTEL
jgi:hypothetical protein